MGEPRQTTLAIDTATDDIEIPIRLIRGNDAYTQRLSHRFQFFIGEYFLDLRRGVPYWDWILTKLGRTRQNNQATNRRIVRALITRVIESMPGTKRVLNIDFDFNTRTRVLTVSGFEIETTDGEVFRSQPEAFVLEPPIEG